VKKYILIRCGYSLITLWLLVTIIFAMVRLTGDPVKMKGEVGADATYLARIRHDWGLDQPVYWQYTSFVGNLLRADFGHSFEKSLPVRDIYFQRLPNSLKLGFAAFVMLVPLAVTSTNAMALVSQRLGHDISGYSLDGLVSDFPEKIE